MASEKREKRYKGVKIMISRAEAHRRHVEFVATSAKRKAEKEKAKKKKKKEEKKEAA